MILDVVVIGGANFDIKAKSRDVNKLGTSNPGEVMSSPGGVGRNIAHNLARLGAKVGLISVVGSDVFGDAVLAATERAGVDISGVVTATSVTGTYIAMLDHDGELITALNDMRAVDDISPAIIDRHRTMIDQARVVVADCNLRVDTLLALASIAADRLVIEPVSVPKSEKLIAVLAQHSIFLASPNFDQIESLSGSRDIQSAFAFMHGKGLQNVVIHAGAEGAFVSNGTEIEHVEAQPAGPMIDVTGAGDAAVAGLVYGLLQGFGLAQAAAIGQQQAGLVIASDKSFLE